MCKYKPWTSLGLKILLLMSRDPIPWVQRTLLDSLIIKHISFVCFFRKSENNETKPRNQHDCLAQSNQGLVQKQCFVLLPATWSLKTIILPENESALA